MDISYILNIINNYINNYNPYNPPQPVLYRGLHINEEQDAYQEVIVQPNGTVILYGERMNHKYYFAKFNEIVYHIVTNEEMSKIYCIRVIEFNPLFADEAVG
jgi:hypothetical protein